MIIFVFTKQREVMGGENKGVGAFDLDQIFSIVPIKLIKQNNSKKL